MFFPSAWYYTGSDIRDSPTIRSTLRLNFDRRSLQIPLWSKSSLDNAYAQYTGSRDL